MEIFAYSFDGDSPCLQWLKGDVQKGNGGEMNGALMTIDDLASYLKVTRRTIYAWLKDNKIPAVKLVGQWRFKKDKIDAWIEDKAKQY